jgi:hypothetical protein
MSVVDAVGELRTIGFFDDRAGTDREVAEAVIDDFRAMWGRLPTADDELLDLELPRFDPDRVWWEDIEADVAPGTDAYVRAIDGWAAISRGALRPSGIVETWDSPRGPVRIALANDRRPHELVARYLDAYLDMGVLDQLNEIIADGPYRFLIHAAFRPERLRARLRRA